MMTLRGWLKEWLIAMRPKTLLISVAPVLLGQLLAYIQLKSISLSFLWLGGLTLACALSFQVAVNLANDYFDHKAGVDGPQRLGPKRVDGAGSIKLASLKRAFIGFLFAGVVLGLNLVLLTQAWELLALGALCVLAVLAYSSGPFPLAYNGLGELVVFVIFGPIAVYGAFYVQTSNSGLASIGAIEWCGAVLMGSLAAAVMLLNNIRDAKTDLAAGKTTLAITLGELRSRRLYQCFLLVAAVLWVIIFESMLASHEAANIYLYLLSLAPLIFIAYLMRVFKQRLGVQLNKQLGQTAMLMLLLTVGLILPEALI